jgi:2-(1,2-epoxy-1,2-dihydrophenyl)acetyl-CoA isomerase
MAYPNLDIERSGHVARVRLNRPDVINALNPELVEDLCGCLDEMDRDPDVRAIVLGGAGRGFCAGGDVSFLKIINAKSFDDVGPFLRELFGKLTIVTRVKKPVIGALHGFVLGAGFGIALMCDVRIAARNTTFGAEFAAMGIAPELGVTHILPNLVGLGRALDLVLTARRFKAEEALTLGIVNKMVEDGHLADEAMAVAERMAALPPVALGSAKEALRKSMTSDMAGAMALEAELNARCYKTEDHAEAVAAFMEKRKPVFKGR